jgi:hypothetical protein
VGAVNGRTPGGNPNRRHQYTFRLLPSDITRLDDRARRLNVDRSKLLEVLIRRGLDQFDRDDPVSLATGSESRSRKPSERHDR